MDVGKTKKNKSKYIEKGNYGQKKQKTFTENTNIILLGRLILSHLTNEKMLYYP